MVRGVKTPGPDLDTAALERVLRERVHGEVRFDVGTRGAYAADGSNYRQMPIGVMVPRSLDAGAEAVVVCARFGAPVLSRGGRTSLGGQCINAAVIVDWTSTETVSSRSTRSAAPVWSSAASFWTSSTAGCPGTG